MPDWNPSYPDVLGLEFLATHDQKTRVFTGSRNRTLRLPSTTAESITALRLSASVNPEVRHDIRTLIDVYEEGATLTPHYNRVYLAPNSDVEVNSWRNDAGGSTNLWQSINQTTTRWPGPALDTRILDTTGFRNYRCTVGASQFDTGGARENARIGFVSVTAIMAATTGSFRKVMVHLVKDGVSYAPAGGGLRDTHGFGAMYPLWWGELNPETGLPWTPADIASFDVGGDWTVRVRSQSATADKFPTVHALALEVVCADVENREAVGVWRRPEDGSLVNRLSNIETDDLISLPSGSAGWSKPSGVNHLYYWRQSITPALYGPVVADDVRWNGLYQELGPGGEPPGVVYPLHHSGSLPIPDDVISSDLAAADFAGKPQESFASRSRAAYGLALIDSSSNPSIDSQPYRLDLADLVIFTQNSGVTGQRVTPSTSEDYLGFRLPIIPPFAASTLTISVHRVSDSAQMGGSFSITAAELGNTTPVGPNRVRYLTGFLSAGASLVGGTQYEIRLAIAGPGEWIVYGPDSSLAPEVGFGGTTDGAVINGVHQTNKDLAINLLRQPDPPENLSVAITDVPVTTSAGEVATVEHVSVGWDAPASSMGGLFARYELERRLNGGNWHRIANIADEGVLTLPGADHEVPRDTEAVYRIRGVGTDGRISMWTQSNPVTPTAPGSILILTSNHAPELEVVHLYNPESTYPVLSINHDEYVALHGSDNQVVFMEAEDRGTGWDTTITLNQVALSGRGGIHVLDPLLNLIRSTEIPYVCAMDHQGTAVLGHVEIKEPRQQQPLHIYTAAMSVVPTESDPVPVEVV